MAGTLGKHYIVAATARVEIPSRLLPSRWKVDARLVRSRVCHIHSDSQSQRSFHLLHLSMKLINSIHIGNPEENHKGIEQW